MSVTAASVFFHWPTLVTLCWCVWNLQELSSLDGCCLGTELLAFEISLRFARVVAILLHESAHVLAAFAVSTLAGKPFPKVVFGVSCRQLLAQLLPGLLVPGMHVEVQLEESEKDSLAMLIVRTGGLVYSALLPLLWPVFFDFNYELVGTTSSSWLYAHASRSSLCGALLALDGAVLSDLPSGPLSGLLPPLGIFCCGNWGLLVPRERLGDDRKTKSSELFPNVCVQLLNRVLDVVEMRGAQAGGLITYVSGGANRVLTFRSRTVKTKRGHLGVMMFGKFKKALRWNQWTSCLCCRRRPQPLPIVLAQGHSRFGTSSAPAECETHPHQWLGNRQESVWAFDERTRKWTKSTKEVCVTITHNGDFDGWNVFDEHVPNGTLGEWLKRLHHFDNTAKGDSPKCAGLMDMLITKGMWAPSVKYAFVRSVLKHVDQAAGWNQIDKEGASNTMPKLKVYEGWAMVFEKEFNKMITGGGKAGGGKVEAMQVDRRKLAKAVGAVFDNTDKLEAALGGNREAAVALQEWQIDGQVLNDFCYEAIRAFFLHDLFTAMKMFFARAEGTFGVTASCSLWPSKCVLVAKGQPISLAFDAERPMVFWASEPSSLMAKWPSTTGKSMNAGTCRLDMYDAVGEAIELLMCADGTANSHVNSFNGCIEDHSELHRCRYFALPTNSGDSAELPYHILVRGMSLDHHQVPMMKKAFVKRLVTFPAAAPVTIQHTTRMDPIQKDLYDVPDVISEIDDTWGDRTSLNRISAAKFAKCLAFLINNRDQKGGDEIDLLIYGIENSLWLGQQFGADLALIFPSLRIVCISSNWIVGMLQQSEGRVAAVNWTLNRQNFKLARHGMTLAVSQSGTTYPSTWATRLLARHPQRTNMFALSGDFDTVLANSIGQSNEAVDFGGNLFSTMSGLRPCEPSTVATLAMQHTLTHLLLFTARHLQEQRLLETFHDEDEGECGNCGKPFMSDSLFCRKCGAKREESGNPKSPKTRSSRHIVRASSHAKLVVQDSGAAKEASCTLGLSEISDLDSLVRTFGRTAEELVGVTDTGIMLKSLVLRDLYKMGDYISGHLTEPYWSTIYSATYVYLTVTLGYLVLTTIWTNAVGEVMDWHEDSMKYIASLYVVRFADANVYVFLGMILATVYRWCTKKRLFTRYTGRGILIVDCTVNYKLLRAYVSKLRALCHRLQCFSVFAQNPLDHFVHEYTHLAHSDVLLVVGRQDGRIGTLSAAESAVIMAAQQARYTSKSKNGGIEALSVGHNPWTKPGLFAGSVTLPTRHRPQFLSQEMLHTEDGGHAPSSVVPKVAHVLNPNRGHDCMKSLSIEFNDLKKRMMGRGSLAPTEATEVVRDLIYEQAQEVGIGKDDASNLPEYLCFSADGPERSTAQQDIKGKSPRTPRQPEPGIAAANIMALIRSTKMQTWLEEKRIAQVKVGLWQIMFGGGEETETQLLNRVWTAWIGETAQKQAHTKAKKSKKTETVTGEWRKCESIRRALCRSQAAIGINDQVVFQAWKRFTRNEAAAAGRCRPASYAPKVGHGLASKGSGAAIMREMWTVETLYETRIAAAERLLAFYVIFHRAVSTLSKLPLASFDIDRSESRLRVASTPAPIPFVEHLPNLEERELDAIMKIQRNIKKKLLMAKFKAFVRQITDEKALKDAQSAGSADSAGSGGSTTASTMAGDAPALHANRKAPAALLMEVERSIRVFDDEDDGDGADDDVDIVI